MTWPARSRFQGRPCSKVLGQVRILSNLRYNEGNEIAVGGARWRQQAL